MRERIIQGSDDESDDFDEVDDVHQDRPSVEDERATPYPQGGFQAMMEQASQPADEANSAFNGVEMTDLTDAFSLEGLMEANSSRRSRTTMETLRTTSYQNRGNYGSTRYDGEQETIIADASSSPLKNPTEHHSSRSAQQSSSQAAPAVTSMQEDCLPSSREIFAVGSTLLPQDQSADQSFHTQTTIPLTMTGPVRQSPMVVIPAGPLPSSGVLSGEINDIADYLQHDIANASELNKPVSGELPSTDPPTERSGLLGSTVAPSNLILHYDNDGIPEDKRDVRFHNSQLHVDDEPDAIKSSSRTSRRMDERSSFDGTAIDLPKEMYKPRPSRSRAKRPADDLDLDRSSGKTTDGLADRVKVKRRKTAGDTADDPLSLDDDTPASFARKVVQAEIKSGRAEGDAVIAAAVEQVPDTIELNPYQAQDVTTSQGPGDDAPAKSAKKKRGRPRKSKAKPKPKSDVKRAKTPSQDDLVDIGSSNGGTAVTGPKKAETRRGRNLKPNRSGGIGIEDSEDELAGIQPDKKSHAVDNDTSKADLRSDEAENRAETEEAEKSKSAGVERADTGREKTQLPKKRKRGRKPKRKTKETAEEAVDGGEVDEEEDPKQAAAESGSSKNDDGDEVERQDDAVAEAEEPDGNENGKEEEDETAESSKDDASSQRPKKGRRQKQRQEQKGKETTKRRPLETKPGGTNAQRSRAEPNNPTGAEQKADPAAVPADQGDGGEDNSNSSIGMDVSPAPTTQALQTPSAGGSSVSASRFGSPIPTGKVPYRVGLSRRSRIEPLLKIVRRQ